MFFRIFVLFVCLFSIFTLSAESKRKLAPFSFEKNQPYRLENQINGTYIHIGKGWWAPNETWDKATMTFVFPGSPGGLWKFKNADADSVYIYNDSKIENKPETVYLVAPSEAGKKIIISALPSDDAGKWIIKRVLLPGKRDIGLFTIQNKKTALYLTSDFDWNAPNLRENHKTDVLVMPKDSVHSRAQYWSLEPTVLNPIETLSVPQGGWGPWALDKIAVYSSNKKLRGDLTYSLKNSKEVLYRGKAFYWGQFWNNQYFYIINLNVPQLQKTGLYYLFFNKKRVPVRITNHAYTKPYRQYGRDRFSISDLFDPQWGFVGHWGHLSTWYPKGLKVLGYTERTWIDEHDDNKNGKKQELIQPLTPITDEESKNAFLGGWDMTDKSSHSWGCDGDVLKSLYGLYNENDSPQVRKSIVKEIEYGVKGLLANQDENGSWRQRTTDWTYWVGTTANIASGLASVCTLLQKHNVKLAVKTRLAVNKAWDFVYKNRFDRTKWAIKGEGILPNGEVLNSIPQSHRQGYTEAYISFAVEMSLLTGEKKYKREVDNILERAVIDKKNNIHSIRGAKFPGEQRYSRGNASIILTLFRYYPIASVRAKDMIHNFARVYYEKNIVSNNILGGPYGKDGQSLFYDYTGGQWRLPSEILIACEAYKLFGNHFAQGIIVSQRKMDWWLGCNPYYTSLILGVGDKFLLNGWSSYHALGRQVGMNSGPTSNKLEASKTNYIGKETTTGGAVLLWWAIAMLEKISIKGVDHITIWSQSGFKGNLSNLTYGDYDVEQLTALGMKNKDIESIQVPAGFEVILFSKEDFKGDSFSLTTDSENLGNWTNKTVSLKIRLKKI